MKSRLQQTSTPRIPAATTQKFKDDKCIPTHHRLNLFSTIPSLIQLSIYQYWHRNGSFSAFFRRNKMIYDSPFSESICDSVFTPKLFTCQHFLSFACQFSISSLNLFFVFFYLSFCFFFPFFSTKYKSYSNLNI